MKPTTALRRKAMQLLAADTGSLAPAADELYIALVKSNFNSVEEILLAGITLADFDGADPIAVELGAQNEGIDPVNGASRIDLIAPVGGWYFKCTGTTDLPQTIYGYVLLNNAQTVVLASQTFDTPINITAVDQVIELDDVTLSLPYGSIS